MSESIQMVINVFLLCAPNAMQTFESHGENYAYEYFSASYR